MRLVLFVLVSAIAFAQSTSIAQMSDEPENGNLIAEPTLSDYVQANRSPGIMSEPYDIVDQNGDSVQF